MPVTPAQRPTFDRVKTLLRRDLKLDPQADIPDDMPLIGGHLDLDSLDVLMVITTIEKEFGVKAPMDGSAKEVFKTVTTLANYLDAHAAPSAAPPPATPTKIESACNASAALDRLPHRDPFRFVSRIENLHAGVRGCGLWVVTGREAFFGGHFPDRPVVPGVLITEALAQFSGLVASSNGKTNHDHGSPSECSLAQVNIRFHHPAQPPADIRLESRLIRTFGALVEFEVRAAIGDQTLADGTLTLGLASTI